MGKIFFINISKKSTMEGKTAQEPIVMTAPKFITMGELNPGTRVTMHLLCESVNITRERKGYEGTINRSADCLVGDAHGCAILVAKDDQLNIIKAGAHITIRNAHANVVKENMRIEIDRWAKVEVCTGTKATSVNHGNNLSEIEYELVPVNKH